MRRRVGSAALQDSGEALQKDPLRVRRRCVAEPQADHCGRRTAKERAFQEVSVLSDDAEPMLERMVPDRLVAGALESDVPHMRRVRADGLNGGGEAVGQVLIEQELQRPAMIRRSPSAAYARQARMSSDVRSGWSAKISCSVMPEASQPRTSYTVIRSPRMQGRPPRLPGSTVMISR